MKNKAIYLTLAVLAGITLSDLLIDWIAKRILQGYHEVYTTGQITRLVVNRGLYLAAICYLSPVILLLLLGKVKGLKRSYKILLVVFALAYSILFDHVAFNPSTGFIQGTALPSAK